jgi:very-short-patch-repair endonuclease
VVRGYRRRFPRSKAVRVRAAVRGSGCVWVAHAPRRGTRFKGLIHSGRRPSTDVAASLVATAAGGHSSRMVVELDGVRLRALFRRQHGAVSRAQLLAAGVTREQIATQLRARRWQRPIPGIYVTFTGPLPRLARYWVALLHAGSGAVLSHSTAGALWRLTRDDGPVHVTVPRARGVRSRRGVVIHRLRSLPASMGSPPRATVSETVIMLCQQATRSSEVTSVLGRAAQLYPREFNQVAATAASSRTLHWRAEILAAAQDVAGGAHSELERRYLVDVERAHGLPKATRQRAVAGTRQDAHYDEFATTVELDGRAVHQPIDNAWRDMKRDNAAARRNETTLRYGWDDVRHRPCDVAAEVAAVLRARGWQGRPKSCGPHCSAGGS